ncbi:uncharacterized protein TRIADDRAFT_27353 [Trichoplax adhaerens]|uniref:phenylalanine--tRNA ligase n=1 Tax=Trichoplax adhaerens TaxID=10228 RepID=B3S1P5_TRIAD|nr:hypothetical protein TRIADDRAFT_27353 [Trichoplax adhaerens]EDV23328.1 hypothetical protein TRIADDRAFT_27353 [Trichoplax adhaerens]|eukprot:XP_002114238.1 hypothetical protein TRIADDRAFT_27353 [Trichoplax adhaerens]
MDKTILETLSNKGELNTYDLSQELSADHQAIVGAMKSVQSLGEVICVTQKQINLWVLTKEAEEILSNGSYEARIYEVISDDGSSQKSLMNLFPNARIGLNKAMSLGWLRIEKNSTGGDPKVFKKVDEIEDRTKSVVQKIKDGKVKDIPDATLKELKKRKLINAVIIKSFDVTKGPHFTTEVTKMETELSPEMLATNSWKEKKFKPYNFDSLGIMPSSGHLHPLMKVRAEVCQIFLEMGFTEMPTNNYVESSFWNFDALFQPQQHPARDAQDTFFLSDPENAREFPTDYLEKVQKVHESGGYRSIGYRSEWKLSEARKNVLRTHTTGVSARMLYKLGQMEKFKPVKYFSIDKVFRNESVDATHLAEFHQVEGVVADYDVSLASLISILYSFFSYLGIKNLRFKPAYNPYTEPSMEIFTFHEGLKKWVEIGNSGVFRPEMIKPMGLPDNVNVLGWGLSLERPTMVRYGINDIRDLVGHKVNLQMVYDSPICRLDSRLY